MLPAATEMVCALGLRESLVGRSHECDFPEDILDLPALTRARVDSSLPSPLLDAQVRAVHTQRLPLYKLDEAGLAALAPDLVVTQAACEVCAVSFAQVEATLQRTALSTQVITLLPSRLDDVIEDARRVATAGGVPERGDALAARLRARLGRVAEARPAVRLRVAIVEWLEPLMLAGHWVPEAVEAAGGVYLGPAPGQPSPYGSWDALRALAPDVVVVAPCGFDLPRVAEESQPHRERLRTLAPRVLLMDGNAYWNRPGPRLVDAVEMLAAWLRGQPLPPSCALPLEA